MPICLVTVDFAAELNRWNRVCVASKTENNDLALDRKQLPALS